MKNTLMPLAVASCFAILVTLTQADPQEDLGDIIKNRPDASGRSSTIGISGVMNASDTPGITDPSGSTRVIDPSGIPGVMGLPGTSGGMDPSSFVGTRSSGFSSGSTGGGH